MNDDQIILVTDSYDVIMTANSDEILQKYKSFNKPIVFACESCCWPDETKEKEYPRILNRENIYLNSGGFIGNIKSIKKILSNVSNHSDDQLWYTNIFLSEKGKELIELDYDCKLFQCLNNGEYELNIDYSKSRLYNKNTKVYPCQIHGNGGLSRKSLLNQYENYLMKQWSQIYGYNSTNKIENSEILRNKEMLFISIYIIPNSLTDNFILTHNIVSENILYLKKKLSNIHYSINNVTNDKNKILLEEIGKKSDYVWIVNDEYIIENNKTLYNLIIQNKGIISPLLTRQNDLWSNFWGKVDNHGWYQRSFDYIDITNGNKKGCWNVPFISGNILIQEEYIELVKDFFTGNIHNEFNQDMNFCWNCRKHNIFLYVDNLEYYGYIADEIKDEIPSTAIHKELYLLETNIEAWKQKYLHPNFREAIENWDKLSKEELCSYVFEFPMVTELFCDHLLNEINNLNEWSGGEGTNTLDKRINNVENIPTVDIHLSQIGFIKQWEYIVKNYIAQLVNYLFSPYKTEGINISFIVKYELGKQEFLKSHHDNSTYTVGITLNEPNVDFKGGGTRFVKQNTTVQGKKGYATLHPGRLTHYHEGIPITEGKRFIFITFVN